MKHELIMENWRRYLNEQDSPVDSVIDSAYKSFADIVDKVDDTKKAVTSRIEKTAKAGKTAYKEVEKIIDSSQRGAENFLKAVNFKKPRTIMEALQPQTILNSLILLNSWQFFQKLIPKYTPAIESAGKANKDSNIRMAALEELRSLEPWQIDATKFAKLQSLVSVNPNPGNSYAQTMRSQLNVEIQDFRNAVIKQSFTDLTSAREYADQTVKKAEKKIKKIISNFRASAQLEEGIVQDFSETYNEIRGKIIEAVPDVMGLKDTVIKYIDNKEKLAEDTIYSILVEKSIQGLGILIAAMVIIIVITKVIAAIVRKFGKKVLAAAALGATIVAALTTFFAAYAATTAVIGFDNLVEAANKFSNKILGVERIGKKINQIFMSFPDFESAAKGQKQGAGALIDRYGAPKHCKGIPDTDFGRRLRPDCFE